MPHQEYVACANKPTLVKVRTKPAIWNARYRFMAECNGGLCECLMYLWTEVTFLVLNHTGLLTPPRSLIHDRPETKRRMSY